MPLVVVHLPRAHVRLEREPFERMADDRSGEVACVVRVVGGQGDEKRGVVRVARGGGVERPRVRLDRLDDGVERLPRTLPASELKMRLDVNGPDRNVESVEPLRPTRLGRAADGRGDVDPRGDGGVFAVLHHRRQDQRRLPLDG